MSSAQSRLLLCLGFYIYLSGTQHVEREHLCNLDLDAYAH